MINAQILFSSLYEEIKKEKDLVNQLNKLYPNDGYYVFRRKKHDQIHYDAYLKANNKNASVASLTLPAFPTYLLAPDNILNTLEKSPKLTLIDGFRKSNWNDVMGDFFCTLDDIEITTKKYTVDKKLLHYLNKNFSSTIDEYIYSIYFIKKIDIFKYQCCFIADITQKNDKTFSLKNQEYTQLLQPYTVIFSKDLTILSSFG